MLENLTDRMTQALRNLRGMGRLTEDNISDSLQEVRQALLSADVHFKVSKNFIDNVKSECLGQKVTQSITPGQQIVKIINDELVKLLGEGKTEISSNKPLKIMLVGLHGSGKTTSAVKLGAHLKKKGYSPALVACDIYRPAAIDQLETLGKSQEFPVYADRESQNVPKIGKKALSWAKEGGHDAIVFDTAGRLQIDDNLIKEIQKLKDEIEPDEILLVGDAALGQEAVNVAQHFHEAVKLTGIILTKLDGDSRGGAALSMKAITGVPIKFMGTGEKIENFDLFHPDRMARRILGMGDVVSLVEKAQETVSKDEAKKMAEKLRKAEFNFEDFLSQIRQIKKMGSIASLTAMLPGMNKAGNMLGNEQEQQLKRTEAIISSMTAKERQNPKILTGSRRMRIAKGAGVEVRHINQLLKQFQQMRKLMKSMKGTKGNKMKDKMSSMLGGDMSKLGF